MITKRGSGFPDAIETVEKETSDTYTVSYTTAVLALAMLAKELGAEQLDDATLGRVPGGGGRGDRGPVGRRHPPARTAARARGRRSERRDRPRGRAEGPRGVALPGRGLRRRVPAARLRRAARRPRPLGGAASHPIRAAWSKRSRTPARRSASRSRAWPSPPICPSRSRSSRSPRGCSSWRCGSRWSVRRTPTPSSSARGTTRRPGRSAPRSRSAPRGRYDRTNSLTAASSRSPTSARTTVPSPSGSVPRTSASR